MKKYFDNDKAEIRGFKRFKGIVKGINLNNVTRENLEEYKEFCEGLYTIEGYIILNEAVDGIYIVQEDKYYNSRNFIVEFEEDDSYDTIIRKTKKIIRDTLKEEGLI